jgi:hypothetical protein
MTAYSTAVGPSSFRRNSRAFLDQRGSMVRTPKGKLLGEKLQV